MLSFKIKRKNLHIAFVTNKPFMLQDRIKRPETEPNPNPFFSVSLLLIKTSFVGYPIIFKSRNIRLRMEMGNISTNNNLTKEKAEGNQGVLNAEWKSCTLRWSSADP